MMKIIRNLSLRRCFTTKECPGCGATFQKSQPNHAGYLPEISPKESVSEQELQEIKLKKGPLSVREAKLLINSACSAPVICKRCHSFKSGSKRTISLKTNVVQFANLKINSGGLVIVVLDLLDLHGTLINNIHEYVGQKDMIVVLNKADLMPKGYNFHKVKQYLKHKPSIQNCSDLFEISAKTGQGIPQLLKHMENAFMKNEDCYMVGCTSVGKSSLFNYLKKLAGDEQMATTSRTSGTTNGLIKMSSDKLLPLISTLNLSESTAESLGTKHLYDTAGIVHESQLYNLFGDKELSYVFPHNPIILKKFMRKKGQSLYLGGFIRLEIQEGECEIFLYCSKKLPTFECKTARLEIAEKKIANSVLYPPILTTRTSSFPPLVLSGTFKNQNDHEQTIFISGTGWFTLQGNCEFSIYSPNGLGIHQLKGCFVKPKEVIHKLPTPDLIE